MFTVMLTLCAGLVADPSAAKAVEIVAHRGASWDAPENTVASIKLAWRQQADGSEFDIYLSKDGKIVVLHDKDLKRTGGVERNVVDLTAAELKAIDVGQWKGKAFAGETVPTLEDLLATVPTGKRVFIEVKCGPEIVDALDRALKASGLPPERTPVISFSADVIASMKKARPDVPAYWLVSLNPRQGQQPPTAEELIARARELRADGLDLSANPDVLTPAYARAIKDAGLGLYVWTVNDVDVARTMIAAGVDGITTDRPEWLRDRLENPAHDPSDVRIMSFNIRYGTASDGDNAWPKRKSFLIETIKTFDPDLLGTQETLAFQRDDLAAALASHDVLAAGRDDGRDEGEMMALFYRKSRFEKLAGGHFWLSENPESVGSKSWDSSLPRMVTWVKLRDRKNPAALPIVYLNTHFDHRGPKARLESARLLRRKVDEIGKGSRVIVSGDFNSGEGSEPYRALFDRETTKSRVLLDTFRTLHPNRTDNEGTFSGFRASATAGPRIDWIGCTTDWDIRAAAIDRTARDGRTPSDHVPITAILRPKTSDNKVDAGPTTLRVLCYNIHHGEGTDGKVDLPRLAKVIRDARPDLVALQEVDRKTMRTGGVDQTAELARLTGLHGEFGKQIDYEGGEYGQAILSRFPLSGMTVHWLPGMPERERRIAFEARVTVGGREVSFVTTHLHHISAEFRAQQAAKLNELFEKADRPVILAGDLNANPDSKPLDVLSHAWTVGTAGPSLFTYPAEKPAKTIDYILFRPSDRFRAVQASVVDEAVASDHRPVLAVLELQAP